MVEGTLLLCDCPAELTEHIAVSLDHIEKFGLTVRNLDGRLDRAANSTRKRRVRGGAAMLEPSLGRVQPGYWIAAGERGIYCCG